MQLGCISNATQNLPLRQDTGSQHLQMHVK